jgi:hypothetical protein
MANKSKKSKVVSPDDIKRLVADWGGFEKLVAELSATGDVNIEHNAILKGPSGIPRQIDVVLRHTQGLYDHLIIVECKYWNKRVSRLHVDTLITTVKQLNASKGAIFSTVGFQSGAILQARQSGIDLFTVRFPTNREWGLPGRYIDFYLHVLAKSVSNFMVEAAHGVGSPVAAHLALEFGQDGSHLSETPVFQPILETVYPKTLEGFVMGMLHQAAVKMWTPEIIADGGKWTRKFWASAECKPTHPIMLRKEGAFCLITKINFDIGLSILQSRITVDRAEKFSFVLAIDDHVKNVRKAVSKEKTAELADIAILRDAPVDASKGPVVENGSIMSAWTSYFFPFDDVSGLPKGDKLDVKN